MRHIGCGLRKHGHRPIGLVVHGGRIGVAVLGPAASGWSVKNKIGFVTRIFDNEHFLVDAGRTAVDLYFDYIVGFLLEVEKGHSYA